MPDIKDNYREKIAGLLTWAGPRLTATQRLEFKNVFGAVGGYVNGRIFCSWGKFGFAIRLPPETLGALFREKEAKHLKYFSSVHIKREYAVLPVRILGDKGRMKELLDESIRYVLATGFATARARHRTEQP